jgi:hypothetical protein
MAFVVEEVGRSADVGADDANTERNYYASGYASEAAVVSAVLAYLVAELGDPPNIGGQVVTRIAPTETEIPGDWRVRVQWNWAEEQEPPAQKTASSALPTEEDELSFSIGVETVKVQFALQTMPYPATEQTLSSGGNAIHFNPKTKVAEGIDIYDPAFSWSETHYFHESKLTREFRRNIMKCVGKTNAGEFRGNAAGEVLFMGVSGRKRSKHDYFLTFEFKHRENTTLTLSGIPESVEKKGWDYIETVYTSEDDEPVKLGVLVHTVFEEADFDNLGIGS